MATILKALKSKVLNNCDLLDKRRLTQVLKIGFSILLVPRLEIENVDVGAVRVNSYVPNHWLT